MKRIIVALSVFTVLVMSLPTLSQAAGSKNLYLYIWSEYLPDAVLKQFTKETGIKVTVTTYDSNEAMYAKVKMAGGYDLVVPSTDFLSRMRKENLLLPLDKTKIGNFKHLDPRFINQSFDPNNTVSVPYMWGTTAIAVNTKFVDPAKVKSFADLFKPEFKGKLLLPDDARSAMTIGLKMLGYSLNDINEAHVQQAYDKVKPLMASVKVFNSDSPKQPLLNGEVKLGVMWNGEAYVANSENAKIVYVYPTEGFSMWVDNLAIPKGAKNIDNAHAFINFLLRPEISKQISEELGYATPNLTAFNSLPAKTKANAIVYPKPEDFKRGEFETDLGPATQMYEKYWTKLKMGK